MAALASSAVETVTGCTKTYVAQFVRAEGFSHTHFHVIPRPANLPEEHLGPGVFWTLICPVSEQVSAADGNALTRRLHPAIANVLEPAARPR